MCLGLGEGRHGMDWGWVGDGIIQKIATLSLSPQSLEIQSKISSYSECSACCLHVLSSFPPPTCFIHMGLDPTKSRLADTREEG